MPQKERFPELLKIAVVPFDVKIPTYTLQIDENTTKNVFDGKLISLLSEVLEFKFEVVEPYQRLYGTPFANGNWTGMFGMLQWQEVDLAFGKISRNEERLKVADFSFPYDSSSVTFITDKPVYITNKSALLDPFNISVWIALSTCFFLVLMVLRIIENKKFSLQSICLTLLGCLLQQQSGRIKFKKAVSNFLIILWIIAAIFISQFYKADFLSYLSIPSLSGIFTIQQLSKASEKRSFLCSGYETTTMYNDVLNSSEMSWKSIHRCLIRSKMYTDDVETFMRSTTDKKAFIGLKSHLQRFRKMYFLSEDSFMTDFHSIAIRKMFCCKDTLDKAIHRLASVGLLQKLVREEEFFIALGIHSTNDEEQDHRHNLILLADLSGTFMILLIGHFVAVVIFVFEVIFDPLQRMRVNSKIVPNILLQYPLASKSTAK